MFGSTKLLIPQNLRQNNFDLLRLFFAVLVLYSHSYVIFYGTMDKEPMKLFSQRQTQFGTLAVYGFFIISGFLIIRSCRTSNSVVQYFKKRFLRIWPGFAVALLFSLMVAGPLGTIDSQHPYGNWHRYFTELPLQRFLIDFFSLQSSYAPACFKSLPISSGINGSLWTIQHEVLCYLLVPSFAATGLFRSLRLFVISFIAVFLIMILLDQQRFHAIREANTILINWPGYLPRLLVYFLAGGFFFLYHKKIVRSLPLALICLGITVAALRFGGFNLLFPFTGTYLLFYIAFHPRLRFSGFSSYGDFSYGTYLYAWPVQQLTLYFFKDYLALTTFFLLSLAFTLVLAFLSWHIVEKPFLRLKEKQTFPKKSTLPVFASKEQVELDVK